MKAIAATYPYDIDEVTLIWRRSWQHPLGVDPVLNFEDQLVLKPSVSKRVICDLVHQDPEKLSNLQVNSRSSSFKEGVSDTDRFETVLGIFKDIWKSRKGDQKNTENEHRKARRQKTPRDARMVARDASVPLDHLVSSELIAKICLFKYFIS